MKFAFERQLFHLAGSQVLNGKIAPLPSLSSDEKVRFRQSFSLLRSFFAHADELSAFSARRSDFEYFLSSYPFSDGSHSIRDRTADDIDSNPSLQLLNDKQFSSTRAIESQVLGHQSPQFQLLKGIRTGLSSRSLPRVLSKLHMFEDFFRRKKFESHQSSQGIVQSRFPMHKQQSNIKTGSTSSDSLRDPSILVRIFSYLPVADLAQCARVSKKWYSVFVSTESNAWNVQSREGILNPVVRPSLWTNFAKYSVGNNASYVIPHIRSTAPPDPVPKSNNAPDSSTLLPPEPSPAGERVLPPSLTREERSLLTGEGTVTAAEWSPALIVNILACMFTKYREHPAAKDLYDRAFAKCEHDPFADPEEPVTTETTLGTGSITAAATDVAPSTAQLSVGTRSVTPLSYETTLKLLALREGYEPSVPGTTPHATAPGTAPAPHAVPEPGFVGPLPLSVRGGPWVPGARSSVPGVAFPHAMARYPLDLSRESDGTLPVHCPSAHLLDADVDVDNIYASWQEREKKRNQQYLIASDKPASSQFYHLYLEAALANQEANGELKKTKIAAGNLCDIRRDIDNLQKLLHQSAASHEFVMDGNSTLFDMLDTQSEMLSALQSQAAITEKAIVRAWSSVEKADETVARHMLHARRDLVQNLAFAWAVEAHLCDVERDRLAVDSPGTVSLPSAAGSAHPDRTPRALDRRVHGLLIRKYSLPEKAYHYPFDGGHCSYFPYAFHYDGFVIPSAGIRLPPVRKGLWQAVDALGIDKDAFYAAFEQLVLACEQRSVETTPDAAPEIDPAVSSPHLAHAPTHSPYGQAIDLDLRPPIAFDFSPLLPLPARIEAKIVRLARIDELRRAEAETYLLADSCGREAAGALARTILHSPETVPRYSEDSAPVTPTELLAFAQKHLHAQPSIEQLLLGVQHLPPPSIEGYWGHVLDQELTEVHAFIADPSYTPHRPFINPRQPWELPGLEGYVLDLLPTASTAPGMAPAEPVSAGAAAESLSEERNLRTKSKSTMAKFTSVLLRHSRRRRNSDIDEMISRYHEFEEGPAVGSIGTGGVSVSEPAVGTDTTPNKNATYSPSVDLTGPTSEDLLQSIDILDEAEDADARAPKAYTLDDDVLPLDPLLSSTSSKSARLRLPPLPFSCQANIIERDVARTFGEMEARARALERALEKRRRRPSRCATHAEIKEIEEIKGNKEIGDDGDAHADAHAEPLAVCANAPGQPCEFLEDPEASSTSAEYSSGSGSAGIDCEEDLRQVATAARIDRYFGNPCVHYAGQDATASPVTVELVATLRQRLTRVLLAYTALTRGGHTHCTDCDPAADEDGANASGHRANHHHPSEAPSAAYAPGVGTVSVSGAGALPVPGPALLVCGGTAPDTDGVGANPVGEEGGVGSIWDGACKESCRYDSQGGYTQGLNFIAGQALRTLPESSSFWALNTLTHGPAYAMGDMFGPGLWKVGLASRTIDFLLKAHLPTLSAHLHAAGITPDIWATNWLLPLFASSEPLGYPLANAIWDAFWGGGWSVIFQTVLTIMKNAAPALLSVPKDLGELLTLIRLIGKAGKSKIHHHTREDIAEAAASCLPDTPQDFLHQNQRWYVPDTLLSVLAVEHFARTSPERYQAVLRKAGYAHVSVASQTNPTKKEHLSIEELTAFSPTVSDGDRTDIYVKPKPSLKGASTSAATSARLPQATTRESRAGSASIDLSDLPTESDVHAGSTVPPGTSETSGTGGGGGGSSGSGSGARNMGERLILPIATLGSVFGNMPIASDRRRALPHPLSALEDDFADLFLQDYPAFASLVTTSIAAFNGGAGGGGGADGPSSSTHAGADAPSSGTAPTPTTIEKSRATVQSVRGNLHLGMHILSQAVATAVSAAKAVSGYGDSDSDSERDSDSDLESGKETESGSITGSICPKCKAGRPCDTCARSRAASSTDPSGGTITGAGAKQRTTSGSQAGDLELSTNAIGLPPLHPPASTSAASIATAASAASSTMNSTGTAVTTGTAISTSMYSYSTAPPSSMDSTSMDSYGFPTPKGDPNELDGPSAVPATSTRSLSGADPLDTSLPGLTTPLVKFLTPDPSVHPAQIFLDSAAAEASSSTSPFSGATVAMSLLEMRSVSAPPLPLASIPEDSPAFDGNGAADDMFGSRMNSAGRAFLDITTGTPTASRLSSPAGGRAIDPTERVHDPLSTPSNGTTTTDDASEAFFSPLPTALPLERFLRPATVSETTDTPTAVISPSLRSVRSMPSVLRTSDSTDAHAHTQSFFVSRHPDLHSVDAPFLTAPSTRTVDESQAVDDFAAVVDGLVEVSTDSFAELFAPASTEPMDLSLLTEAPSISVPAATEEASLLLPTLGPLTDPRNESVVEPHQDVPAVPTVDPLTASHDAPVAGHLDDPLASSIVHATHFLESCQDPLLQDLTTTFPLIAAPQYPIDPATYSSAVTALPPLDSAYLDHPLSEITGVTDVMDVTDMTDMTEVPHHSRDEAAQHFGLGADYSVNRNIEVLDPLVSEVTGGDTGFFPFRDLTLTQDSILEHTQEEQ